MLIDASFLMSCSFIKTFEDRKPDPERDSAFVQVRIFGSRAPSIYMYAYLDWEWTGLKLLLANLQHLSSGKALTRPFLHNHSELPDQV